MQRTADIGLLDRPTAVGHGCTGPVLRGSGVDHDLRRDGEPIYTALYDGYQFDVPVAPFEDAPREAVLGDCWSRYYVRMLEVVQSVSLVRQALDRYEETDGDFRTPFRFNTKLPKDECYLETECPAGRWGSICCATARRCRCGRGAKSSVSATSQLWGARGGVFHRGHPAIVGSLDVLMGEIDR